jgi:hypothetical protein
MLDDTLPFAGGCRVLFDTFVKAKCPFQSCGVFDKGKEGVSDMVVSSLGPTMLYQQDDEASSSRLTAL